jgi:hypothetical protein
VTERKNRESKKRKRRKENPRPALTNREWGTLRVDARYFSGAVYIADRLSENEESKRKESKSRTGHPSTLRVDARYF